MKILKSALKIQSFYFDFNVDGGAVASYNTGIMLPAGVNPLLTLIFNNTVNTSGGGTSRFQLGIASNVIKYDNFPIIGTIGPSSLEYPTNKITTAGELIFTIALTAWISGSFSCHVSYIEAKL